MEMSHWDKMDRALWREAKNNGLNRQPKPSVLYHGSPYKLKKGEKIEPKGPLFYGFRKSTEHPDGIPGVNMSANRNIAERYAKESDQGGINKRRYGKALEPKFFAQKGHLYQINTENRPGIFKIVNDANLGGKSNSDDWGSYKAVGWDKHSTVRFKGKVPITRNEAIGGTLLAVGAGVGSYEAYKHRREINTAFHNSHLYHSSRDFYYRHHNGKQIRVKKGKRGQ